MKYFEKMRERDIDFIYPGHEFYPESLNYIPDPPKLLFTRGDKELLVDRNLKIAVVGARNASVYGKSMAYSFGSEFARNRITVVSGLALGIDGMAHSATLENGGATIAVLGSGIDVPYPRENYNIYHSMCENGLVISEYGMGVNPDCFRFPLRNRIISGLANGVLVVEAKERSGSLITADQALEQGRDVFAIPGRTTDINSVGCNNLIKQGAYLVSSPREVIDILKTEHGNPKTEHRNEKSAQKDTAQGDFYGEEQLQAPHLKDNSSSQNHKNLLAPIEKRVYSCVRLESRHVDDICFEADVTVSEAASALFELERKKLVKQLVRNYYVRV
jgi:DNA processing protein